MSVLPSVSIVMSVTNRPKNLLNTLKGWSIIDYPDYDFTLIDNGSENPEIEIIANQFKDKLHLTFYKSIYQNVNRVWNKYGKAARGEYVVFAMADEIISHKNILQKMVRKSTVARTSIFTYFLDNEMTVRLSKMEWEKDPRIIPLPPTNQTSAGLISHITGNYKKNWEWFGWFVDEPKGYLWLDQNIYLRELCLGKKYHCKTPTDVYCLHQWHPTIAFDPNHYMPGYIYKTKRQARLLEPAEKE